VSQQVDETGLCVDRCLVTGDVETKHIGVGVVDQCIRVRGAGLVESGQVGGEGVMGSHEVSIGPHTGKE
jgi:hypothetical protein